MNAAQLAETLPPDTESQFEGRSSNKAPEQVGNYRLLRLLGSGGMGRVYEAEDVTTNRRVAVKLISTNSTHSHESVERFRQEGRLASTLVHPRCVFVLAADEENGLPYIVMELMPGSTLEDLIKQKGPLPPEEAIEKILDVIDGLQQAHELGIIHRDVKPNNCFLDEEGRVKVGDFGLSKSLTQDLRLTRTGAFLGTPLFASPEQIKGEPVNAQTDVYSVAATLYYLLAGKPPIEGSDAAATLARIIADPPEPLRKHRPDIDPMLEKVVLRGLEKDPARRWRSLKEFKAALQHCQPNLLSPSGLGLRFAAYLADQVILWSALFFPMILLLGLNTQGNEGVSSQQAYKPTILQLVGPMVAVLYFGLAEGIWGYTVGKFLLRLRACRLHGISRPGLFRGLARSAIFYCFLDSGTIVWLLLWQFWIPHDVNIVELPRTNPLQYFVVSLTPLAGLLVGVGLLLSPMRRRNGFRGLHEWLTGTRIIELPVVEKTANFPELQAQVTWTEAFPASLGSFEVSGIVHTSSSGTVLVGSDVGLGRKVWLWRRAQSQPALSENRCKVNRRGRLRWLACGEENGSRWDAFVWVPGCTLTELVKINGPLPWSKVRPLLEQLTSELATSAEEGTLPSCVQMEHIWVQPDGTVKLMDFCFTADALAAGCESANDEQLLALVREAAVLLLEGRSRPPGNNGPIKTPVPVPASKVLRRLVANAPAYQRIADLRADWMTLRQGADEITRARRLAHLAIQTVFLSAGLFWIIGMPMMLALLEFTSLYVLPRVIEIQRRQFDDASVLELAVASVNPNPMVRLRGVVQRQADEQFHEQLGQTIINYDQRRESILMNVGWFSKRLIDMSKPGFEDLVQREARKKVKQLHPAEHWRRMLHNQLSPETEMAEWDNILATMSLTVFLLPVVCAGWAFLLCGGISYRLAGIALVRSDGRPAARWQCAWRALLVWLPLAALFYLCAWLNLYLWRHWQPGAVSSWVVMVTQLMWYVAVLMAFVFVGLAIWRPSRSIHDMLAGTHLVPR